MHHGSAKVGVLVVNPQAWQYVAAHQKQPTDSKQAQRPDNDRSGNNQRDIEDGFKHGAGFQEYALTSIRAGEFGYCQ